jgi:acetyl esterase/lipase
MIRIRGPWEHTVALWLLLVGMTAPATAPAAARAAEPATAATPVLGDHYPERVVRFPGGVSSYADVVYAQYPGYRPQILDLYLPPARKGAARAATHPLIVHVHGGGWVGGHTRHAATFTDFPRLLASLAARGYIVASIEYRLANEATSPAQVQDVKAAIKWLRAHAPQYGIDATRVAVWGGSAGGHLAALVGTSCGARELEPPAAADASVNAASDCVQAVATWYGVFDVAPLAAQANMAMMLGCAKDAPCSDEQVRIASPVRYLDSQDPPFLLIHGEADQTVDVSQSRNFHAALQAAHVPGELLVIPGVDHSFVGATAEITHAAAIQALHRTFAFFDATVGARPH